MNKKIYLFILLAVFLVSCGSSTKTLTTADYKDKKYNPETVIADNLDWADVTINGKVQVGISSSMVMKMIKGKSISISLRPMLGIEMGKLHFEGDTVTVIDKYHNVYMQEPVGSFLGDYVSIEALQSLFLSRPFVIGEGFMTAENCTTMTCTDSDAEGKWMMFPRKQPAGFSYQYDLIGNNISNFKIAGLSNYELNMSFSNFVADLKGNIAYRITSQIPLSGKIMALNLTYKSVKWDTGITDNITVPEGSRKLTFAEILQMISNM